MSSRVVGLDIGGETTRVVEARLKSGAFEIRRAAAVPTAELSARLRALGLKGSRAIVGVTGRDMILRTTQVPPVPAWQLKDLMAIEADEVADQSGDELSSDFNILGGAAAFGDEDMVLLALVRNSLIAERTDELAPAGVKVAAFTPNAVALHNAVVATDGGSGTVMVAALGGRNTDIALLKDGELLFARNLGGGGDLFTEALADTFRIDADKAEAAKHKLGVFAAPGDKLTGQQGAVARALDGALRQVVGMLQSSVVLCRNQLKATDLTLDRVLLCGPGAAVPGLDQALTRAMGLPVARFDPTDGYVTGEADIADGHGPDFAVATGLALMGVLKEPYRIQILPESVRRQREFRSKTLWLVLAGVLVAGFLAFSAVTTRDNWQRASDDLARLRREVETRKADSKAYDRTLNEARESAARLAALEDITAPGSGVLATLDVLDATLPPELWVTSLRSTRAVEPQLGHGGDRRPMVLVDGHGKEQSRNLSDAVTDLTMHLRQQPAIATVLPRMNTDTRGAFSFSLSVDTSVFPAAPGAAEGGESEDDAAPDAGAAPAPAKPAAKPAAPGGR